MDLRTDAAMASRPVSKMTMNIRAAGPPCAHSILMPCGTTLRTMAGAKRMIGGCMSSVVSCKATHTKLPMVFGSHPGGEWPLSGFHSCAVFIMHTCFKVLQPTPKLLPGRLGKVRPFPLNSGTHCGSWCCVALKSKKTPSPRSLANSPCNTILPHCGCLGPMIRNGDAIKRSAHLKEAATQRVQQLIALKVQGRRALWSDPDCDIATEPRQWQRCSC